MTQESIKTTEADSELDAILERAFIPYEVIEDLRGFGLTTPDQAYSFIVNNPSLVKSDVQAGLGIDWSHPVEPEMWVRLLNALRQSGALSPGFLDIEDRQAARAYDAPLAALGPTMLEAQPVTAGEIIAAVNSKGNPSKMTGLAPIDLRKDLIWPVRDQRPWPSCMGFAVAACLELQLAREKNMRAPERLSARFLYRLGRGKVVNSQEDLMPAYQGGGLKQADVAEVLKHEGASLESLCRDYFEMADSTDSKAVWPNPVDPISQEAVDNAKQHRFTLDGVDYPDYRNRPGGLALTVYRNLKAGKPVAISIAGFADPEMPSGNIWHAENFWDTGVLRLPEPHHIVGLAGHAVCVVGYLPKVEGLETPRYPNYGEFPGYFLFRNSWGEEYFARNSPLAKYGGADWDFPRGYGLIPAAVMEYFVWEIGTFKR
jgi:hypothetical protein